MSKPQLHEGEDDDSSHPKTNSTTVQIRAVDLEEKPTSQGGCKC